MFKSTVSLYQYLPVPNQEEISKTKIPRKNIVKEGTKLKASGDHLFKGIFSGRNGFGAGTESCWDSQER